MNASRTRFGIIKKFLRYFKAKGIFGEIPQFLDKFIGYLGSLRSTPLFCSGFSLSSGEGGKKPSLSFAGTLWNSLCFLLPHYPINSKSQGGKGIKKSQSMIRAMGIQGVVWGCKMVILQPQAVGMGPMGGLTLPFIPQFQVFSKNMK